MDHVVELRDLEIGVGDDRKNQIGVLRVVDVLDPARVFGGSIGGQAERLHIALLELVGELRGATHFGSADGREVGGMAEEEDPAVARPFMQADLAILGVDGEIGGGVADMEAHMQILRFEWICNFYARPGTPSNSNLRLH